MTLEDLRVFVAVAGERSFSRAARKLRRTQPAVSQAVRRLEAAVGRAADRPGVAGRHADGRRRAAARLRDPAPAAVRRSRHRRRRSRATSRRAACSSARTRAASTPCCRSSASFQAASSGDRRRGAPHPVAADGAGGAAALGRLRCADVQSVRARAVVAAARHRRAGAARQAGSSAGRPRRDHDGRDGTADGHRPQRSRRLPASACCACTNSVTRRSTSACRCRAWTASSARWRWGSASRCCRAAARRAKSRAVSWPRSACRSCDRRGSFGSSIGKDGDLLARRAGVSRGRRAESRTGVRRTEVRHRAATSRGQSLFQTRSDPYRR